MRILHKMYAGLFVLTRGGGPSLTKLESEMILMVAQEFNPSIKALLQRQLKEDFIVDRTNDRISSIHFYRLPDTLLIPDPEFQDLLYKVKMKVNGRVQTNRVTFYEGRIFGVELRKPRKEYEGADIEIVEVTKGEPKQSLTAAIDRAVHGNSK